ncbi:hypothetical protein GUJ93_ZPchr0010g10500 [Zizania palustris]|uniref:Uncharacterized protein n=1 Tax=Zizania palustris TaxID=103762 RepID=A0A8J5W8Z3_ZIZPA|nr:hypothetical protein GUJ93_ZPchr0010g10500 [Zizania palustris]
MGKKRVAPASAAPPVFPFPEAADDEPRHFSDYGFEDNPRLRFFYNAEATRPAAARRQQQQPLESARFKLQKLISKKPHRKQQQQRRRRWWSSAASAALLFFKRGCYDPATSIATATATAPSYSTAVSSQAGPLYLANDDDDDGAAACTCWAPAMRSGHHLATAELGASASVLPYVSLREDTGGAGGGRAPAMPIYLVT